MFFRSHANPEIFARHRFRFAVVPPLLLATLLASEWALVCAFAVAALWDLWHSALQNFGIGRIYDAKLGNPPDDGRSLDRVLHLLVYVGPALAGPSIYMQLEDVRRFSDLGWETPARWLAEFGALQPWLGTALLVGGALFLWHYVLSYRRPALAGYRISRQKVVFLVSVGSTSIIAWTLLPPLEALVIVNVYHAVQYLGIVWWVEKRNIRRVFGLSQLRFGHALALVAWLGTLALLATGTELGGRSLRWAAALGISVALLHFWYDGFIWSVRRREVDPA